MPDRSNVLDLTHPAWRFLSTISRVADEAERTRLTATTIPAVIPCDVCGVALLDDAEEAWNLVLLQDGQVVPAPQFRCPRPFSGAPPWRIAYEMSFRHSLVVSRTRRHRNCGGQDRRRCKAGSLRFVRNPRNGAQKPPRRVRQVEHIAAVWHSVLGFEVTPPRRHIRPGKYAAGNANWEPLQAMARSEHWDGKKPVASRSQIIGR